MRRGATMFSWSGRHNETKTFLLHGKETCPDNRPTSYEDQIRQKQQIVQNKAHILVLAESLGTSPTAALEIFLLI